jgi:predicted flap endonuclease-1-like 5' DNA nuclease
MSQNLAKVAQLVVTQALMDLEAPMRERDRREPYDPRTSADDLRKISGIGPVVALRLGEVGITSYRQLAVLTVERIAELLADVAGISVGRIASQDWIGQARQLAGDLSNNPEGHQRYATFHVELLIDQDCEVRRTKVRHYQTDTEESWPGWDQEKLLAVFRGQSALDTSSGAMPAPLLAPAPSAAPPPIHFEGPRPAEEGSGRNFRLDDQPTSVRIALRLDRSDAIGDSALDVVAQVAARVVGSGNLHDLGTIKGTIALDQPTLLELTGPPLSAGLYSLMAAVSLYRHGYRPGDEQLFRHSARGELIHVTRSAGITSRSA